ncbi:Calcineurin-like phosphoesterase [Musa troglodytarum]|uniref:Calcineurin-like phosphoesterase n=1 Tax=Musa troglodytarum TaxID=320322 RepID=A0A9E7EMM6_9LILI|nr:Calcineurin-like phosphoesterase [Musa troglodytarum]
MAMLTYYFSSFGVPIDALSMIQGQLQGTTAPILIAGGRKLDAEVRTLEDEKFALLDQLVFLEGLLDPSCRRGFVKRTPPNRELFC